MSKKFFAENKETGEKWKPSNNYKQYLVMYDSGYIAVVSESFFGIDIEPLNPQKWRTVIKYNIK